MRALLAACLALLLVLAAGAPHVHQGAHGADECVACAVRHGAPARDETPELAPAGEPVAEAPTPAGLAPVHGAPLGAVPGQSPPRDA